MSSIRRLDKALVAFIDRRAAIGMGVRTSWVDDVYDGVAEHLVDVDRYEAKQIVSDRLWRLAQQKKIRFVTERFRKDNAGNWTGDYCWVVPFDWKDRPTAGYSHVEKVDVPMDRVWGFYPAPTANPRMMGYAG